MHEHNDGKHFFRVPCSPSLVAEDDEELFEVRVSLFVLQCFFLLTYIIGNLLLSRLKRLEFSPNFQ